MSCHGGNPTYVIGDPVKYDLGKQASGELRRVTILTHSVGDAILSILYGRMTTVSMCSKAYKSKMLSYRAIFGGTHLYEPDCWSQSMRLG